MVKPLAMPKLEPIYSIAMNKQSPMNKDSINNNSNATNLQTLFFLSKKIKSRNIDIINTEKPNDKLKSRRTGHFFSLYRVHKDMETKEEQQASNKQEFRNGVCNHKLAQHVV